MDHKPNPVIVTPQPAAPQAPAAATKTGADAAELTGFRGPWFQASGRGDIWSAVPSGAGQAACNHNPCQPL